MDHYHHQHQQHNTHDTPLFLEPYISQAHSSSSSSIRPSAPHHSTSNHILPPLEDAPPHEQQTYRLPPAATVLHQDFYQQPHSAEERNSYDQAAHNAHASPYSREESPLGQSGDPNDPKRSRACEACRGLKVRCSRDETQPDKPCTRCAKARRECIITAPSRKRQKKTDNRMAELEKQVETLTALAADLRRDKSARSGVAGDPISPPESNNAKTPPHAHGWRRDIEDRSAQRTFSTSDRSKRRQVERSPDMITHMSRPRPKTPSSDEGDASDVQENTGGHRHYPFDRVVDQPTATRVFDRYVAEMAQHMPAVVFEPGITAADVRATRPVLFLAILDTASVGMLELEVQEKLNSMLLDAFANSILRNGEKSLDLIQALMVSTIWYRPPKKYEQMNVYMLTHIAALMALDFGMGRKLNASRSARVAANVGQSTAPQSLLRSDSVEARRTWLGCYFVCMNVSISYRRPPFIRSSKYISECIKVLESAPETLPSDKRLCQQVRLMQFNETLGNKFSMDDPSAIISISDPRVQFAIDAFVKELDELQDGVPRHLRELSLEFSQHFSRLYAHEIALHHNHNIDDFRAPFTEESLRAPSLKAKALSPYHEKELVRCLESVHAMFGTFSRFDVQTVKALPIFYFVRIAYAVVMLIKLNAAVSDPESDQSIRPEDLQVEYHLDQLLQTFQRVARDDAFRPARMFMIIISNLRNGFKKTAGRDAAAAGARAGSSAGEQGSSDRNKIPIPMRVAAAPSKAARQKNRQSVSQKSDGASRKTSQSSQGAGSMVPPSRSSQQTETPPMASQVPEQMNIQQQLYHQAAQQHQQQQMNYVNQPQQHQQQNPLQFLSEVATSNAPQGMMDYSSQQQQQQHQQHLSMPLDPEQMWFQTAQMPLNMDFDQALNMTMSIGEGDMSCLLGGTNEFGYGQGMIPQGNMNVFGGQMMPPPPMPQGPGHGQGQGQRQGRSWEGGYGA